MVTNTLCAITSNDPLNDPLLRENASEEAQSGWCTCRTLSGLLKKFVFGGFAVNGAYVSGTIVLFVTKGKLYSGCSVLAASLVNGVFIFRDLDHSPSRPLLTKREHLPFLVLLSVASLTFFSTANKAHVASPVSSAGNCVSRTAMTYMSFVRWRELLRKIKESRQTAILWLSIIIVTVGYSLTTMGPLTVTVEERWGWLNSESWWAGWGKYVLASPFAFILMPFNYVYINRAVDLLAAVVSKEALARLDEGNTRSQLEGMSIMCKVLEALAVFVVCIGSGLAGLAFSRVPGAEIPGVQKDGPSWINDAIDIYIPCGAVTAMNFGPAFELALMCNEPVIGFLKKFFPSYFLSKDVSDSARVLSTDLESGNSPGKEENRIEEARTETPNSYDSRSSISGASSVTSMHSADSHSPPPRLDSPPPKSPEKERRDFFGFACPFPRPLAPVSALEKVSEDLLSREASPKTSPKASPKASPQPEPASASSLSPHSI